MSLQMHPRTIVRMSRFGRAIFVAALALAAPLALELANPVAAAFAEEANDLAPGTQLMALGNVSLHQAEIAKGSKVSVASVLLREGKLEGASLELADGHIVKVGLATIRSFFKVVDP